MKTPEQTDDATAVYRAYGKKRRLLYVGVSRQWVSRWTHHAAMAPFYRDVVRLEIEWFPTRIEALSREREFIERLHPAFNKNHQNDPVELLRLLCPVCGFHYSQRDPRNDVWALARDPGDRCNDLSNWLESRSIGVMPSGKKTLRYACKGRLIPATEAEMRRWYDENPPGKIRRRLAEAWKKVELGGSRRAEQWASMAPRADRASPPAPPGTPRS